MVHITGTTAQRARRGCFHDAAWAEYFTQPRIPEGAVHLILGHSLIRVLTGIQSHWQVEVFSFSGAATPQMLASLEMLDMVKMYTVTLMMGTNDVSRGEPRKLMRLHEKMSCIFEELRIYLDAAILTICTVPYNMKAEKHAREMNEKVRKINEVIRQIHQRSVLPLRLLNVANMMEHSRPDDASSDGIHFDRLRGTEWLNGVFQRHINLLESDMLETAQFKFGLPRHLLFLPLGPYLAVWERESTRETAQGAAGLDNRDPHRWKPTRQSHPRPKVRWCLQWWWRTIRRWRDRRRRARHDI